MSMVRLCITQMQPLYSVMHGLNFSERYVAFLFFFFFFKFFCHSFIVSYYIGPFVYCFLKLFSVIKTKRIRKTGENMFGFLFFFLKNIQNTKKYTKFEE